MDSTDKKESLLKAYSPMGVVEQYSPLNPSVGAPSQPVIPTSDGSGGAMGPAGPLLLRQFWPYCPAVVENLVPLLLRHMGPNWRSNRATVWEQ